MIVRPFRGLRPRSDLASRIPSPPYDVVSSDEAREMAAGDEYTFLHVIKPEIDLDPALDPHDESVYAMGAANLRSAIENGRLVRDEKPAYYVYRLSVGDQRSDTASEPPTPDDINSYSHSGGARPRFLPPIGRAN